MSDSDRFDLRTDPHYHLRCLCCGAVQDVEEGYHLDYDQAVARETGYRVLCHRMVFEGICPACQQAAKAAGKPIS